MADKEEKNVGPTEPEDSEMKEDEQETPAASRKRNILVDPDDTSEELADAKRPKLDFDKEQKYKCLLVIVNAYNYMATELGKISKKTYVSIRSNITTSNHILSIIFTCHNYRRQEANEKATTLLTKTSQTDFKIMLGDKEYVINREAALGLWDKAVSGQGFKYEKIKDPKVKSWCGTMGPYLNFFGGHAMRIQELRVGHSNAPISKENGSTKSFPVSKYGLTGAHHILLEGIMFPPERRSSMVQSLGPMTAFLLMLRTEGNFRTKFADAVKRCMSHIPCIDDIISMTKNTKKSADVGIITRLVADILLITTGRQATRMFFPINILVDVYETEPKGTQESLLRAFTTTGPGGFYVYKKASEREYYWQTQMREEMASQVIFHGIFGTYKEDLGILSQITGVGNWFTREEMGKLFQNATTVGTPTKIKLPKFHYYAKMACANQSGLLTGVYNQVTTHSVFSGKRTRNIGEDFFTHLSNRTTTSASAKSLNQLIAVLSSTLDELILKVSGTNKKISEGTTPWHKMEDLKVDAHGTEVNMAFETSGKMFMGRNKK